MTIFLMPYFGVDPFVIELLEEETVRDLTLIHQTTVVAFIEDKFTAFEEFQLYPGPQVFLVIKKILFKRRFCESASLKSVHVG